MKNHLTLFLLCLAAKATWAQKINENFRLHIARTDQPIEIDGLLNEPVWEQCDVAENFHMIQPVDTALANQFSEIRMTYDDKNLYLSLIFFNNSVQGNYIIESLRRDFSFNKNDNFLLAMDPFNNKTTGFSFGVSAYGAQWDGTMSNGGSVDLNWDTKWVSAVTYDDEKWMAEMAIPLKSIRYKEGEKEWGINFSRLDLKANEKSSWAPVPRQFPSVSLAYTGVLVWDNPPPVQKNNISLIPYALATSASENGNPADSKIKIGGDAKVSLTPSLNLDLTVNPDFSQAEVDQQVTNLDRFELFFPERRQFFLENADLFANIGYSTIRPFFSRRIGLGVPIQAGARISGNLDNNWRLGLMNIQTQSQPDEGLPNQNFGVLTLQRKVLARSNVNFLMVNKQSFNYPTGTDPQTSIHKKYNRNMGMEFNFASPNNLWNGKAFVMKSFSPDQPDHTHAIAGHIEYKSFKWNVKLQQEVVGENFNAEVGYVPRRGFTKTDAKVGYLHYLNRKSALLSHGPSINQTYFFNQQGRQTDQTTYVGYLFNFLNRSTLEVGFINQYIKLQNTFDPIRTGIAVLEAGTEHRWSEVGFEYNSKPQSLLTYTLAGQTGGYFNGGQRSALGAEIGYRFQPYLSLSSIVNYNSIDLPAPWNKNTFTVLGIKADLTLTNKLFFSNLYQYNEQRKLWNFNSRLQWRYQPASDLFIVFNSSEINVLDDSQYWNLTFKLNYWLNFNN
jgi:hypothetical protein